MSSIFKIFSKEDCDFYYDGELQGHITGNSDKAFRFEVQRKGSYRVRFVNSFYGSELMMNLAIEADEEQVVDLDFKEVNTPGCIADTIFYFSRYYTDDDFGPSVSDYVKREDAELDARVKALIKDSMEIIESTSHPFKANTACEAVNNAILKVGTDIAAALKTAKSLYFRANAKTIRSPELLMPIDWKFRWGFMDWNGNEIIPCVYDQVDGFKGGYAAVCIDSRWGLIDLNGNEVVPRKYSYIGGWSEGFACVQKDGKWGYVDIETGKEIVIGLYDYIYIFCEGLACVEKNNRYGFIDKTGKEIAPCIYTSSNFFREGLAFVCKSGKCGYIDKIGNEVIPLIYDYARNFIDGFAPIQKNGKWGFIDYIGREVVPCVYDDAKTFDVDHYFVEGLAIVKKNDKWGFVNTSGKEIVPCVYDTLFHSDGERAFFCKNSEAGYINGYVYMNGKEEIC